MAAVTGTVLTVHTVKSDHSSAIQVAEVVFTLAGTYAAADNGIVSAVATAIQSSRRNGKTVTLLGACVGQTATKASDGSTPMSLKTVAISTADITFEVTDNSYTTEIADGAFPSQERPFSLIVAFYES